MHPLIYFSNLLFCNPHGHSHVKYNSQEDASAVPLTDPPPISVLRFFDFGMLFHHHSITMLRMVVHYHHHQGTILANKYLDHAVQRIFPVKSETQ